MKHKGKKAEQQSILRKIILGMTIDCAISELKRSYCKLQFCLITPNKKEITLAVIFFYL